MPLSFVPPTGITTSANNTVTCLYSAGFAADVTAAPHSLQNLAFSLSSVPHDPHNSPAAVISRGQPTVVHIDIVSPLASQHVPYRHCDVCGTRPMTPPAPLSMV